VTVTVTAEQRDALCDQILDRLSGIGDVWVAAERRDYETAERLGREYSDDLRLVLDDLGFAERPGGTAVELTTPPDVLRRVLARLGNQAASDAAGGERELAEIREMEDRNRLVAEACDAVLAELDNGIPDPASTCKTL
jgi:hypothetical protein